MKCCTHKQLEELEDPLVCENIKCISCDGVNDRQAVNFVFDEGVHCIKQAVNTMKSSQEARRHNTFSYSIITAGSSYLASGDMLTRGLNVA